MWEAKSGFHFLRYPFSPYMRKLQNIIALLHLSVTYFIWCTTRYTMRQTKCIQKLQGSQRSPELALRSKDFCAPENLIFPVMWETRNLWYLFRTQSLTLIKEFFWIFLSKYWKNVSHIFFQLNTNYIKLEEWRTLLLIAIFWNPVNLLMLDLR